MIADRTIHYLHLLLFISLRRCKCQVTEKPESAASPRQKRTQLYVQRLRLEMLRECPHSTNALFSPQQSIF